MTTMQKPKAQAGFSYVIVLIIIVVLGLAVAAFFSVQKRPAVKADQAVSAKQQTVTSATQTYMVIKEWGVRMKTDRSMGNISYRYNAANDSITLTSELQGDLPISCPFVSQSPWGVARQPVIDENASQNEGSTIIENYAYRRVYPQTGCENAADIMQKIDAAYQTMYKSLEKA